LKNKRKMKSVSISGSPRANVGTKDAKELRRNGLVPCVIYGGKEQIHFAAPEAAFKPLIYSPDAHTVTLDVGGRQLNAVLQEAQFHKISDKLLHVDFLEIIPGKPITMSIPVKVEGNSAGVRAGGKLVKKLRFLKVKGLADQMPDFITLDISALEIGQSIYVRDVSVEGLTLLDSPNLTIVSVKTTRNVVTDAAPADAKAAPAKAAAAPAKAAAPKK
jgi:large subunit ribosomal protein L25